MIGSYAVLDDSDDLDEHDDYVFFYWRAITCAIDVILGFCPLSATPGAYSMMAMKSTPLPDCAKYLSLRCRLPHVSGIDTPLAWFR
jgi:hypothetical protein